MNTHPSRLSFRELRDECLDGAECLFDPELHDRPDLGRTIEHPSDRAAREDIAKDICRACPVRDACLDYALNAKPDHGIWAGMTADEIAAAAELSAGHEPASIGRDVYRGVA